MVNFGVTSVTLPALAIAPGTVLTGTLPYQSTDTTLSPANAGKPTRVLLRFTLRRTTAVPPVIPVTPVLVAPAITAQPLAQTITHGAAVTLSVTATGTNLSYQWRRDGEVVPGATAAVLALPSARPPDTGTYTVTISNGAGTVTSDAVVVIVNAVTRISNISILTPLAADGSFTIGYVVGGEATFGAKPLLIRAAGPSLGALGVPGTLDDPRLELFAGATRTGENDNWGGAGALASAMVAVGAFPYASNVSRDAAVLAEITARDNSVKVAATGNGGGTVIAEIYDATAPADFTVTTPRLLNVSVLKELGSGFTAGFVVAGTLPKTILVRAVGPGLAAVGVTAGFVADPQLALFNGASARVGENDNWGGTVALRAAFNSVGAFALPTASRDAALAATLAPGNYSVEVKSVSTAGGLVLVEVYEVP
ncbi:MAG TPA: immunoglobulin domain-containing protein [Opitutaceae bacterium]|nr:immunoglobulin domain-containing protein [Opitutaceae bacterium]